MRIGEMTGGTHRADVSSKVFAMPAGMRMRYDLPAPAIADYVSGYAIYACEGREPLTNWYLPAPPMITVLLDAGPVRLSTRSRTEAKVHRLSLWGSTRRAFRTVTHGGISVGIGLTAAGWARLTQQSASGFCDRVDDLGAVIGSAAAGRFLTP